MEKTGKITDLKPDLKNMNKHTQYGMGLLEKSVRNNKFGRSILVDKDNNVIAGNGILETAVNIGAENIRIIETTGDELVVVKRTDVSLDSKQGREMALADNATSAADLEWDVENIKAIEEEFDISADDWGVEIEEPKETEKLSEVVFTDMYYTPEKTPNITLRDCIEMELYEKKMAAIDAMGLPEDVRNTMELLARRFIKIDFESVANYYAFNATDAEKDAIERLRLVLVDGAIEGFIQDRLLRVNDYYDREDEE